MNYILILGILICTSFSQSLDEKIYNHIKSKTNQTENIILIKEYFSFISQFPTSKYQKNANLDIAEIYYKEEEYHQALAFYLRTATLYRGYKSSELNLKVKSIIENFEESDYESVANKILSALNYVSTNQLIDDLLAYLKMLDNLNSTYMFDSIVWNSELFIRLFPSSINNDISMMVLAKTYHLNESYNEAVLYYNRISLFFEDSELQDDASFSTAQIYEKDLSLYSEAVKEYDRLYQTFPKSPFAPKAIYNIAAIYEKEFENNLDAIKYYTLLLDKFPSDSNVVDGLFRIAKLYEDKNAYDLAINTYKKVLDIYPAHNRTPDAQMNIISAYEDNINDIVKSIEEMKHFAKLFPKHPEASYYLFEAAELYNDTLKNSGEAKTLYKQILAQYSGTSYAEKAEDRLIDIN